MNIPIEILQPLLALAGLLLLAAFGVGLALGLYAGERGRRRDAQEREGVIRSARPNVPRASVRGPGQWAAEGRERELAEPDETFVAQTCAETGCSREEAITEWNRLLGKAMGGGSSGWSPEEELLS